MYNFGYEEATIKYDTKSTKKEGELRLMVIS